MNESSNSSSMGPWPLAVGLLAACVTGVIGIIAGCEPETILYRTFVSGLAVTMLAMLMRTLWDLVDMSESA